MRITATKTGQWRQAYFILEKFNRSTTIVALILAQEAQNTKREIKKNLNDQKYAGSWKPLAPYTVLKKKQLKHDSRMLIETKAMMNSIIAIPVDTFAWFIGIPNITHPYRKTVTISQVAFWMEYGNRLVPARKMWVQEFLAAQARITAKLSAFYGSLLFRRF